MTPFQKKFPNADKDTVFIIKKSYSGLPPAGSRVFLSHDYGTTAPRFFYGLNAFVCIDIHAIELAELKLGDKVECCMCDSDIRSTGNIFIADTIELKTGIFVDRGRYICANNEGRLIYWDKVRQDSGDHHI